MKKLEAPVPRLALSKPEAAAAIGVGPDYFEEHVAPALRIVRVGRRKLVPITELERWLSEHAESVPMIAPHKAPPRR